MITDKIINLTIRIPEQLKNDIDIEADKDRRSLNAEILIALERFVYKRKISNHLFGDEVITDND